MSAAHPCPLVETKEKTDAECLYCNKRAYPGKYCSSCKIYMCSQCHETLHNQKIPKWRQQLSLQRDDLLKQRCVRQRKELNALVKSIPISDLRSIIISYSVNSPTIMIKRVSMSLIWFTFGDQKHPSWIEIRGLDFHEKFRRIIKQASLGKLKIKDKT